MRRTARKRRRAAGRRDQPARGRRPPRHLPDRVGPGRGRPRRLLLPRSRTPRDRRQVRLRQDDDRPRASSASSPAPTSARPPSPSTASTSQGQRRQMRALPRPAHRDGDEDPKYSLDPVTKPRPAHRGPAPPRGPLCPRSPPPRRRHAEAVKSATRARTRRLSARALRRHGPARMIAMMLIPDPDPADRRRADLRPRRHLQAEVVPILDALVREARPRPPLHLARPAARLALCDRVIVMYAAASSRSSPRGTSTRPATPTPRPPRVPAEDRRQPRPAPGPRPQRRLGCTMRLLEIDDLSITFPQGRRLVRAVRGVPSPSRSAPPSASSATDRASRRSCAPSAASPPSPAADPHRRHAAAAPPRQGLRRPVQWCSRIPTARSSKRTVDDTLAEPLAIHGIKGRDASVLKALADVGLDPRSASRYPNQLSGGERERIAIARALMLEAGSCCSTSDLRAGRFRPGRGPQPPRPPPRRARPDLPDGKRQPGGDRRHVDRLLVMKNGVAVEALERDSARAAQCERILHARPARRQHPGALSPERGVTPAAAHP